LAAGISAVSGASVSAGLAACSSTTTTAGVIPLTGISIPAATITAGIGCGTGAGQVYKYAAVLEDPAFGRVYDCYADAAFVNLGPQSDGGALFTVDVFLYDEPTYNANAAAINADVGVVGAAAELAKIPSTFMTTCTGTQIQNIQSVVQCAPVSAGGPGSLQITTDSFSLADGGTLGCHDGFTSIVDAIVDGGISADSGVPTALCPDPLTLGPFAPLTQVSTAVTLLNGTDRVGTTTCRGSIVPNASALAACDPLVFP
jgi:hypothetical protein